MSFCHNLFIYWHILLQSYITEIIKLMCFFYELNIMYKIIHNIINILQGIFLPALTIFFEMKS